MALSEPSRRVRRSQRAAPLAAILFRLVLVWVAAIAPRAPADGAGRDVTYASPDGFRILAGYYRPAAPSNRAVIIFPDPKEGRKGWDSIADSLSHYGFHVLVPDLRGTGESTDQRGIRRDRLHFSAAELAAVSADAVPAIRYIREIPGAGVRSIALIGSGDGTRPALQRSTRGADRFARILVSPALQAGTPSDSTSDPGPLLLIVGRNDILGIQVCAELLARNPAHVCWLLDATDGGAALLRGRVDLLRDLASWIGRATTAAP